MSFRNSAFCTANHFLRRFQPGCRAYKRSRSKSRFIASCFPGIALLSSESLIRSATVAPPKPDCPGKSIAEPTISRLAQPGFGQSLAFILFQTIILMTNQQSNVFRAATQIRSLKSSDNNSFRKATNLGTIKAGRSFSFKVKDSVGANDKVDYFKIKINPGVNSSDSLRFTAQGGGVKLAGYGQLGNGKIMSFNSDPITINSTFPLFENSTISNDQTAPITLYLKISPFDGESTYKIKYKVTP